jgi:hypothetical protein
MTTNTDTTFLEFEITSDFSHMDDNIEKFRRQQEEEMILQYFKGNFCKIAKENPKKTIFINHTQPEIRSLISATKTQPKRRKQKPTATESKVKKSELEPQVEIALKKNYANKVRSSLPKTCSNVKCSHKQYFESEEDAEKNQKNFDTIKGQTTMCPCGHYIRYFINHTRVSNASLSKLQKQK